MRKFCTGLKFPFHTTALLSVLVCAACGAPMSMHGGTSARYYRCQTNKTKGTKYHQGCTRSLTSVR